MHGLDSSNLIPASIIVLTLNAKNKPSKIRTRPALPKWVLKVLLLLKSA